MGKKKLISLIFRSSGTFAFINKRVPLELSASGHTETETI